MTSRTVTHAIDTNDSALLGDGLAPHDWSERRAEHIADLVERTQSAIEAAVPEGVEVVVTASPGGSAPCCGGDLADVVHEAAQTAWIAWTEALPEAVR